MNTLTLTIVAIIYLAVVAYLGFRGYKATRTTADYLVAGRKSHPVIMALSYGATFISTSAIVGFGGAASLFGMGLLWLTFLNIFVGIFIAFVIFGKRTRKMGHHLDAHTFPELIGRRFNSRFIQAFAGLIIIVFMPLYASAVLIGMARYVQTTFVINYEVAVMVCGIIVAAYVIAGGLKGVMYTDALQGVLMFIGMFILIVFAYGKLGGITPAHKALDELPSKIEASYQQLIPELKKIAPPETTDDKVFPWFAAQMDELGKTKKMTDDEKKVFFGERPDLKALGGLVKSNPDLVNKLVITGIGKKGFRGWTRIPTPGSDFFYVLITSIIMGVGIGVLAQPQLAVRFMTVKSDKELNRGVLVGGIFIIAMTGVAFVVGNLSNVWFSMKENGGLISFVVADKNIDLVMPKFINSALPQWFGAVFMLTLLSAAMSTLSSQFHAMGTAIGRDFFEKGCLGHKEEHQSTVLITRIGIIIAIIITIILCYRLPEGVIAVATAIFFGLCASSFLPMFVGGLFWKKMTKAGAIASLIGGFGVSFFWLMFVQMASAKWPALLANAFLQKPTILPNKILGIQWNYVEALFVGLPVSIILAIVVSLITKPESSEHLALCYNGIEPKNISK